LSALGSSCVSSRFFNSFDELEPKPGATTRETGELQGPIPKSLTNSHTRPRACVPLLSNRSPVSLFHVVKKYTDLLLENVDVLLRTLYHIASFQPHCILVQLLIGVIGFVLVSISADSNRV
jgi:hypothetical protein